MSTNAFISGYTVQRSTGGSPESYEDLPEVIEISGFGQTNDTVEVTHFASGGVREYVGGLSDGQEFTVTCNRLPDNAVQNRMISDIADKNVNVYRIVEQDHRGNSETFQFAASPVSWGIGPQVDDRATITFTLKISGDITKS